MDKIILINENDLIKEDLNANNYAYSKKTIVSRKDNKGCVVAMYEIPPKKSAFPYHYHTKNEETYYVIKGMGELKTVEGIKKVKQGDFIYFPANKNGAHMLTNTSETEMLVYIDFDTNNDLEVTIYPDSQKVGIWGKDINKVYKLNANVSYYEDE